MEENYNNPPQMLPAAELYEVYRQHLTELGRDRFKDINGRLTWSYREATNFYTYYRYNHEGQICEIAYTRLSLGGAAHVYTLRNHPACEIEYFINNYTLPFNILRLAIPLTEEENEQPLAPPITGTHQEATAAILPANASSTSPAAEEIIKVPATINPTPDSNISDLVFTNGKVDQLLASVFSQDYCMDGPGRNTPAHTQNNQPHSQHYTAHTALHSLANNLQQGKALTSYHLCTAAQTIQSRHYSRALSIIPGLLSVKYLHPCFIGALRAPPNTY